MITVMLSFKVVGDSTELRQQTELLSMFLTELRFGSGTSTVKTGYMRSLLQLNLTTYAYALHCIMQTLRAETRS